MNKLIILLIGISFIACNQAVKEIPNTATQSSELTNTPVNFDWLLGDWIRTNEELGKETYESWEKKSNTEYHGLGFSMQNGDTLMQEGIRLIKSNTDWNIEVRLQNNTQAVIFKVSSFNEQEFICENLDNDFPKKIKYWKNGNKLNASISGGDMEIPFEFDRIK